jgi:hypothetical protein
VGWKSESVKPPFLSTRKVEVAEMAAKYECRKCGTPSSSLDKNGLCWREKGYAGEPASKSAEG